MAAPTKSLCTMRVLLVYDVVLLPSLAAAVPADFDCEMRKAALGYAVQIQPHATKAQLADIADALNGPPEAKCRNLTAHFGGTRLVEQRRSYADTIFVSPTGIDSNPGTIDAPMQSISAAVRKARMLEVKSVALRAGIYREAAISLGPADSGLALTSYKQEEAVISGAVMLSPAWQRYNDGHAGHNIWVSSVPAALNLTATGLRV
jgi:hypothetical protein